MVGGLQWGEEGWLTGLGMRGWTREWVRQEELLELVNSPALLWVGAGSMGPTAEGPWEGLHPMGQARGGCTSSWGCSLGLTASSGLGVFITVISPVLQEPRPMCLVPGCWDVAEDLEAYLSPLLPPERTPYPMPWLKGDLWGQRGCSGLLLLFRA